MSSQKINFSRLLSLASLVIFCAFSLAVVSSWATRHAIGGGQRFSAGVRKFILAIAEFPIQAKSVLVLLNNYQPPKGVSNMYSGYLESTPLTNSVSGFILISSVSSNGVSDVSLVNLSNNSRQGIKYLVNRDGPIQYSDQLIGSEQRRQFSFSSRQRVWHPYLSKDGSLTYAIPWNDLVSVDLKTGQEKWRVRGAFHHSIEPDANGDLWVCAALVPEAISNQKSQKRHSNKVFEDQGLIKVSPSGKILQLISVADLILKSGLEYLLYGSSNPNVNFDPIHLNQITPIRSDSGVFKKGQILVSLRNLSTILLVDPDSQSVVWHGSGNWMNQHCVIPVGPSTFSVLDNHSFASGEYWLNSAWRTRIVTYNIDTGKSSEIKFLDESLADLHIPIEGRAIAISSDTWMIEDCLYGTIMIFNNRQLVFKWSNSYLDGTVGITSWCRYLSAEAVPELLQKQ
jgi:hypothetical protein